MNASRPEAHGFARSAAPSDRLLRAMEAATMLGVSTRAVWRLRASGVLKGVQIGGATRFRLSDVSRLVERGTR